MSKNQHAVALGRKAKGVPKTLSRTQRQKLRQNAARARAHRWVFKEKDYIGKWSWKSAGIEIGVP